VEYAVVWEVNATLGDPILFSTPSQKNCIDTPSDQGPEPTPEEIENAEKVCAGVVLDPDEKGNCVFDVLTAGEESVEDNVAYTETFGSTERCIAAPIPSESPSQEEAFENTEEPQPQPPTCEDLGGECVFRCDTSVNDCLQGSLCVENADLTVFDERRRALRRMEFIEGCSCRLPKQPSQSPSISVQPSKSPSDAPSQSPSRSFEPSQSPSQSPSRNAKKDKKGAKKVAKKNA